jgi:hypothetical protein
MYRWLRIAKPPFPPDRHEFAAMCVCELNPPTDVRKQVEP